MPAKIVVVSPSPIAAADFSDGSGLPSYSVVNLDCDARSLHADVTGLLIYAPNGHVWECDLNELVAEAIEEGIPILASGSGMHVLNSALRGDNARPTVSHAPTDNGESVRHSIFLAPGAKVSVTIGGSGWLTIGCGHNVGIYQAELAPGAMASAIADDRVVEAFEMPGRRWVFGVQWDVFDANRMPRGFDSILMAFIERAMGQ